MASALPGPSNAIVASSGTALPAAIDILPDEILKLVLDRVRYRHSLGDLLSCLQVCRKWSNVGEGVLLRYMIITDRNLEEFAKTLERRPERLGDVRHLTIHLHMPCDGRMEDYEGYGLDVVRRGQNHWARSTEKSGGRLEMEGYLLVMGEKINSHMRSIETFSLTIEPESLEDFACGCHEPTLDPQVFSRLIFALPPSCTNLELDTGGTDCCVGRYHSSHLCLCIRKLIPQLQHLRLRAAHFCPLFFAPTIDLNSAPCHAAKLLSVTVNLGINPRGARCIHRPGFANADFCECYVSGAAAGAMELARAFREAIVPLTQSETEQGPRAHEDQFPILKQCNVFDAVDSESQSDYIEETQKFCWYGRCDQIVHFDVLGNEMHLLPFHQFEVNAGYQLPYIRDFGYNVFKDKDNEVFIGSLNDMEDKLESAWTTTKEGLRLPKPYREHDQPLNEYKMDEPMRWRRNNLMTRKQYEGGRKPGGKRQILDGVHEKDEDGKYRPLLTHAYEDGLTRGTQTCVGL